MNSWFKTKDVPNHVQNIRTSKYSKSYCYIIEGQLVAKSFYLSILSSDFCQLQCLALDTQYMKCVVATIQVQVQHLYCHFRHLKENNCNPDHYNCDDKYEFRDLKLPHHDNV